MAKRIPLRPMTRGVNENSILTHNKPWRQEKGSLKIKCYNMKPMEPGMPATLIIKEPSSCNEMHSEAHHVTQNDMMQCSCSSNHWNENDWSGQLLLFCLMPISSSVHWAAIAMRLHTHQGEYVEQTPHIFYSHSHVVKWLPSECSGKSTWPIQWFSFQWQ